MFTGIYKHMHVRMKEIRCIKNRILRIESFIVNVTINTVYSMLQWTTTACKEHVVWIDLMDG